MRILSPTQIRMARAMLDLARGDVEAATGISASTLIRLENGSLQSREETQRTLFNFYDTKGIAFGDNDRVERRTTNVRRFSSATAITDLLEDVYETVKDGGDICISGVDEDTVDKYYVVRGERHSVRMARIADKVSCRALLKEGDKNYPYTSYATYRWMPKEQFKPNTFYLYNEKLALVEYKGDICEITIIESPQMTTAFRHIFNVVWMHCKPVPEKREAVA
jgi:transcriptional regulator with XRE-family HTH domain